MSPDEAYQVFLAALATMNLTVAARDAHPVRQRKLRQYDEFARSVTSLSRMAYEATVDYRRKRGMVEEINRAVLDAERDAAERAALGVSPPGVAAGRIDPPREP